MDNYLPIGLESERLHFRPLQTTDFEAWLPFHRDSRSTQYWVGGPADPKQACQQDLDRTFDRYTTQKGGRMALTHKNTGQLIGLCGFLVQTVDDLTELEIGYSILPEYWGQGYASEAAIACRQYAQKNELAKSLISIIHVDNLPSKKVALKNGMTLDKISVYKNNPVEIYRVILGG
ncbi:MAG: GNAT family N-acetyltransferase [Flavobacteriaceae bacterium]